MTWKIITGLFVIVAGIAGLLQFDDRYAKCADTKENFEKLEIKVVQTLEDFQQTQDIRQYDMMQESLERDYNNCKKHQRANPSNPDLRKECDDIKREEERIRSKKLKIIDG
jgi:hypothetical protein